MNEQGLQELSQLLLKQLDLHTKLLDLEKDKKDVLVQGDMSGLDVVLKKEQALIFGSSALEKQRTELASTMGMDGLTLSQIIKEYDGQNKYLLQDRLTGLSRVIEQLKKINGVNSQILKSRLEVTEECLSLLGLKQKALTYNQDGHF